MTGLESAVALMTLHAVPDDSPMWAETSAGRRYLRYASAFDDRGPAPQRIRRVH